MNQCCRGDGSALWRAGKQHGDQVEFIKQQRVGEAGGWRGEWMDRRMEQVPGWAADVMGALLDCAQSGCAMLASFAPPACPSPRGENGKERRERAEGATLVRGSERGDVIERVVQLLADGLVLHLLCIDFVFQVVDGFLQLCHRPFGKLCSGLSLL